LAAADHTPRSRVSTNTAIFASATLISRVAGLARDAIALAIYGTGLAASAFTIASQIPNLMTNLFAQAALSAAFVPVFTRLLQEGRKREAFRLASSMFWIVLIVLGAITLVGIGLAGLLLPLLSGRNFAGATAATLTQIMLPVVVFLAMSGLLTGVLQSHDHFAIPALAPIVWNIVIIVTVVLLHNHLGHHGIYAYAIGWLTATIVQFLLILWAVRRIGFRLSPHIDWHDPRVREVFVLMLPVTVGLGIINLDALINSSLGALVSPDGPRAIQAAFLLYMMPQGVFSVAVATVLFPTLSRQATRRDPRTMRATIGNGMRQINLLLIPSAAGLMMLGRPIIRLLFEHGKFGALSLDLTSTALFWFAWSLPFAGVNLLLTRTFFALRRPWIPAKLAVLNLAVDVVVSLGLYRALGIAGLVIGTAAANMVMAFLQLRRLRIGFNGNLELSRTTMVTARILLASILTGAIARFVWAGLDSVLGLSIPGQLVAVGGAVLAAGAFYVWAVSHMRIAEWRQIELMLARRLGRV
jgi:putative peptidoglycan lipid II flippase